MMMRLMMVLVLVVVVMGGWMTTGTAQAADCDVVEYGRRMADDMTGFGGRMADVEPTMDYMTELYFDLAETRQGYEDDDICDDLITLNHLMILLIATWQDMTTNVIIALNAPDLISTATENMDKLGTRAETYMEIIPLELQLAN